jgi:hypothetical protein
MAAWAKGRAFMTFTTATGRVPAGMYAPARNPMIVPTMVLRAANALFEVRNVTTKPDTAENAAAATTT